MGIRITLRNIVLMVAALAAAGGATPESASAQVDIYVTEGVHNVNGRQWRTSCERYSATERCRTEIIATTITHRNGRFVQKTDWTFNNLTYKASPRSMWAGNPLAASGTVGGTTTWQGTDGRPWRTECDTAATGRGGCRSYVEASVIVNTPTGYQWQTQWVFNNMVRFSAPSPIRSAPGPTTPQFPASECLAALTTTVSDMGPAITGAAVNGAALSGDELFLGSRGAVPATMSRLELGRMRVSQVATVPNGIESWAVSAHGRDVYLGMHTPADLFTYNLDTATMSRSPVASFPKERAIMDQAVSSDGVIHLGGLANGESGSVYSFAPATRTVHDLGNPSPGQKYVRSVAVDAHSVYAGMGPTASLHYRSRAGGGWRAIPIPELRGESFVYDMTVAEGKLYFGTEPNGLFGVVDLATMTATVTRAPGARTIDAIVATPSAVHFTSRPGGALHSYDPATGDLQPLGIPVAGAETRNLFLRGDQLVGVTGTGDVWLRQLSTGSTVVRSAAATGLPLAPEREAQSLTATPQGVFVGGHWGMQRHGPSSTSRIAVPGEPKAIVGDGKRVYAALYPAAQLWAWDPARSSVNQLSQIGANQMRPRSAHVDPRTGQLLIGTRDAYGNLGGAVSVINPATGTVRTHVDVVKDQAPTAITSLGGTAFVGHEIAGEVHAPTTTEARLAALDIATGRVLWSSVPIRNAPAINGLVIHEGWLYGLTSDGWVFAANPANGSVSHAVRAGYRGSALVLNKGCLYAVAGGSIFSLSGSPTRIETTLAARGPVQWLAAAPDSDALYATTLSTSGSGVRLIRLARSAR